MPHNNNKWGGVGKGETQKMNWCELHRLGMNTHTERKAGFKMGMQKKKKKVFFGALTKNFASKQRWNK